MSLDFLALNKRKGEIKKKDFYPLAMSYGYEEGGEMNFITRRGLLKIGGKEIDNIRSVLKMCNGLKSLQEIETKLDIKSNVLLNIIKNLLEFEVIVESRMIYEWFHKQTMDNSPFKKS